jgi:hypothetical protein
MTVDVCAKAGVANRSRIAADLNTIIWA